MGRAVLKRLNLEGRVVTADAAHCQRETCATITAGGGDYLLVVRANQPTFEAAVQAALSAAGSAVATSGQVDRHGNRTEQRTLTVCAAPAALDWPGLQQVARLERRVHQHGTVTTQVRHLITSLPATVTPAQLLTLKRRHWAIENRLHYVRDVTLGEDACRVRTGAAPLVLAALRNVVLTLLRHARAPNIAAALRTLAWSGAALPFLGWLPR